MRVRFVAFLAITLTGCGSEVAPADTTEVVDSAPGGTETSVTEDAAQDSAPAPPADTSPTPDAPTTEPTVPLFVAQGYMGRTIVSCDRGETWVGNRSDNDALRCFSPGVDCDHNGGRAMGIAFGGGTFAATWGWGEGNSIRRSEDGTSWEKVTTATQFSGLNFAADRFVAISGEPRWSTDRAKTFTAVTSIGFKGHVRATGSSSFGGGRFFAAGSENGASVGEVMVSADGKTWARPKTMPSQCGLAVGWNSMASSPTATVLISDDGSLCRTEDGGDTWTRLSLGGTFGGTVIHDGTRFMAYGSAGGKDVAFQSPDGKTWSSRPLTGVTKSLGAIAFGEGRYVAVNGGWDQWYEKQVFSRSDDGVAWTALPSSAYVGSHPVVMIAFGKARKPVVCK